MKKIETIWHHLLHEALLHKRYQYTQQEVARQFGYSLSTIHHALAIPSEIGAIRKESKFFILRDFKKLLFYWASVRHFERDIFAAAFSEGPVAAIEGLALPGSFIACYGAACHYLEEAPADYAKVYWYISEEEKNKIEKRFPKSPRAKEYPNVFFLRRPDILPRYGSYTTLVQTFVDIWNLSDWYSKDFYRALEEKIDGLLS